MIMKNNRNLKQILQKISPIDWVIYLIFPIIISIVYLWSSIYFPNPVNNPLFLKLSDPQWWQFITMNFVHFTFAHFLVNLFVYLLFGLFILFIFKECNLKRKDSIWFLLISFVTFSIITGITSISIYKTGIAGGSSGITAAMFMFLVIVFYFNIQKNIKKLKTKELLLKLASWSIYTIIGIMSLFQKDNQINIFGHLVGIIFGFIIALIFLKQQDTKK